MTAAGDVEEQDLKLNGTLVSEVFHNLSQPLTALHCELELALRRDRTVEELRSSIQAALEDAARLRQRLLLVRALSDAADPGDLSQPTELCELFRHMRRTCCRCLPRPGRSLNWSWIVEWSGSARTRPG